MAGLESLLLSLTFLCYRSWCAQFEVLRHAHRERSISDAFLIQEQELGGSGQGSFLQLWKLLLTD